MAVWPSPASTGSVPSYGELNFPVFVRVALNIVILTVKVSQERDYHLSEQPQPRKSVCFAILCREPVGRQGPLCHSRTDSGVRQPRPARIPCLPA